MTPYQLFLREAVMQNSPEFIPYMEEYEDDDLFLLDEAGKEGVYKENYFLRDHLQIPKIKEPLSKPRNQERIAEFVTAFIDKHHIQFSTSGPVYSFVFTANEAKMFYEIFNTSPDELVSLYEQMVQETYIDGKISPFFLSWVKFAPHKVLFTSMMMEIAQNGYDDIVNANKIGWEPRDREKGAQPPKASIWVDLMKACEYLWAFAEYPIIYSDFWKLGVKKDVMDYTIEHLSPKYKVTHVTNILELLQYDSHTAAMSCLDALRVGQDNTYSDIMQRYRNQFKSKLKNIAIAYYKNSEDNASMHNMTSEFDDGSRAEQEGYTTNQAQTIEKTQAKFSENGVNQEIVRICADGSSVDRSNLLGYIVQIYSAKNNRIAKMVEDIIASYFVAYPRATKIVNAEFINFGLTLYRSLSNSKNELNAEMRNILDSWIELIDIRKQYGREATIINYTRAIFNYFVFLINYYN